MITCPKCHRQYPDSHRFCRRCGVTLVSAATSPELEANRQLLEQRVADAPADPGLLAEYGRQLRTMGRLREALIQLHKAHALAPDDPDFRGALADAYLEEGAWDKVPPLLEPLVAQTPSESVLRQLLAAHGKLGHRDESLAILGRLLQLRPEDSSLLEQERDLLVEAGRHDELRAACRRILASRPDDVATLRPLARSLLLDQAPDARPVLSRIHELDPDDAFANLEIGIQLCRETSPGTPPREALAALESAMAKADSLDEYERQRLTLYLACAQLGCQKLELQPRVTLGDLNFSRFTAEDRAIAARALLAAATKDESAGDAAGAVEAYRLVARVSPSAKVDGHIHRLTARRRRVRGLTVTVAACALVLVAAAYAAWFFSYATVRVAPTIAALVGGSAALSDLTLELDGQTSILGGPIRTLRVSARKRHVVHLSHPQLQPWTTEFTPMGHSTTTLDPALSYQSGWLTVRTGTVPMQAALDGTPIGVTPLARVKCAIGRHTLSLEHPFHLPVTRALDVSPGVEATVFAAPSPKPDVVVFEGALGSGAEQIINLPKAVPEARPGRYDLVIEWDPTGAEVECHASTHMRMGEDIYTEDWETGVADAKGTSPLSTMTYIDQVSPGGHEPLAMDAHVTSSLRLVNRSPGAIHYHVYSRFVGR